MIKARAILGAVREYRFQGNELWVECGDPHMRITFLESNLVRLRIVPGGDFKPHRSWDVTKPDQEFSQVSVELQQTQHALFLHSADFTVRVDKDTAQVEMLTAQGTSFFADLASPVWEEDRFSITKRTEPNEHYYGFGERGGRFEKSGQTMENWTTDPARPHGAFVDPMYMAVPVYLAIRPGHAYGVFVNATRRSHFDLSTPGELKFDAEGQELDVYVAYGAQPLQVLEALSGLLGKMPLPPKWALGYHQSRWSYGTESDVRSIAETFRAKQIPCDVIHLDIDYMHGYRVFTWNKDRFPRPQKMAQDLKQAGFRLVTILDPGVKVDPDYEVYQDGVRKDVFVRNAEGEFAKGYVWPDESVFPDFSRADVRKWWGSWQKTLIETGISGFWNDMNEPAVFEKPFSQGGGEVGTLPEDALQGFADERTTHAELHNLYGSGMAQASYQALRIDQPQERGFHLCRSGFAGIQRWTASWMGDNASCWEHLDMSMGQLLNMGLSAVPFVGVDIGGFAGNATPELFARWMQIGALYPFSRGHSCAGTLPHEPWVFGEDVEEITRKMLSLRYQLMPYLYSVFWQASQRGFPIWRALFLHYPDDELTYHIQDQILIGRYLMAAPILAPGQRARQVYLPEGEWFDWWDGFRYQGGQHILAHAPLDRLPLLVRGGAIIPTGPAVQHTAEIKSDDPLTIHIFPGEGYFNLYEDDGLGFGYQEGQYGLTRFDLTTTDQQVKLNIKARQGSYVIPQREMTILLRDGRQYQQVKITDDGSAREIMFERQRSET